MLILDFGLPQLPQTATSSGLLAGCCGPREPPALLQGRPGCGCRAGKPGHGCGALGAGDGTSCIIDAVIQHPWAGMRFHFLGIETLPGGRKNSSQAQGLHSHPAHPAPHEGGGCPWGLAVSQGCAGALGATAPQRPVAGGRGSCCSQGADIRGPALGPRGCTCTEHLGVRTNTHPCCAHVCTHVWPCQPCAQLMPWGAVLPWEHPPRCFCCQFLPLPAGELPPRGGDPGIHSVLPIDAVCRCCRGHAGPWASPWVQPGMVQRDHERGRVPLPHRSRVGEPMPLPGSLHWRVPPGPGWQILPPEYHTTQGGMGHPVGT